jgi:hypothetical protein
VGLVVPGIGQIIIAVDASVIADLPAGRRMTVVFDPAPKLANDVVAGLSLGGGNVTRVAPPIDIQFQAVDSTTGTSAPLPGSVLEKRIELTLPVLVTPPGLDQQFEWLREFREDGLFTGYFRMASTFDPGRNSHRYNIALGEVTGTLFLPAIISPAYLQNFDPNVHVFSGPTITAVDFGLAGPQFTTFTVVGPQVGKRIYVFNSATNNYGWIDVEGVGPSGPPR